MSGTDWKVHRENQKNLPTAPLQAWRGEVVVAPASPLDAVLVKTVNSATGGYFAVGEGAWPQPGNKLLPEAGDECLVVLDDERQPWVVAWGDNWGGAPALMTELPTRSSDGEEIYFQDSEMASQGIIWHLRYRAGSSSSHKWEAVGGSDLLEVVVPEQSTSSTTYASLSGPSLIVPLPGEYLIRLEARIGNASATGDFYFGFSSGTGSESAVDSRALKFTSAASFPAVPCSRSFISGLAAGTMESKYKTSGASGTFSYRTLSIRPVRVG